MARQNDKIKQTKRIMDLLLMLLPVGAVKEVGGVADFALGKTGVR
jgi:hypothetical protein